MRAPSKSFSTCLQSGRSGYFFEEISQCQTRFNRPIKRPRFTEKGSVSRLFELRLDSKQVFGAFSGMKLPGQPVSLTPEQINELNEKLSTVRHDINNNLS